MYKIFLIILVCFAGCELVNIINPVVDEPAAKAKAFVSLIVNEVGDKNPQPAPTPSPNPKPDDKPKKCETCNGTGKVGDGRVFSKCMDCDGTGVVKTQVVSDKSNKKQDPVYVGTIDVYSADWCLPCQVWKNEHLPLFIEAGFNVKIHDYLELNKQVNIPYYIVDYNGKKMWFSGLLTLDNLYKSMGNDNKTKSKPVLDNIKRMRMGFPPITLP